MTARRDRDEQRPSPRFAHPAERALARVFDKLGIDWSYEPRTFVLERRDGRIAEACTPDFYLPELDIYVECTCMDQKLVNSKNRKYRKLRKRFGVVAEIMYRRDFLRLGHTYGLTDLVRAASPDGVGDSPRGADGRGGSAATRTRARVSRSRARGPRHRDPSPVSEVIPRSGG